MQQFTLPVHGIELHFVHHRSSNSKAEPLLLTHGWPGSVFEFNQVLPMLTSDFHVVCPSIPGYGFSSAPTKRGWGTVDTCKCFNELMIALGYPKYYAQGGDWGAVITRSLGALYPDNVMAAHINMLVGRVPSDFDPSTLSDDDKKDLADMASFRALETGYSAMHGTKPQTLSYSLNDSPVGLAGM